MFGRLMPREGRFFELFNDLADQLVQGARELLQLISSGDDIERRAYNIESIEKRGDKIALAAIELLHRTFITPIDRDDIHQLVSKMDDILDVIEDTSQSIYAYDVNSITPEARRLAELCVACVEKVKVAVGMLSNMDNAKSIMIVCQDIDRFMSRSFRAVRPVMVRHATAIIAIDASERDRWTHHVFRYITRQTLILRGDLPPLHTAYQAVGIYL